MKIRRRCTTSTNNSGGWVPGGHRCCPGARVVYRTSDGPRVLRKRPLSASTEGIREADEREAAEEIPVAAPTSQGQVGGEALTDDSQSCREQNPGVVRQEVVLGDQLDAPSRAGLAPDHRDGLAGVVSARKPEAEPDGERVVGGAEGSDAVGDTTSSSSAKSTNVPTETWAVGVLSNYTLGAT